MLCTLVVHYWFLLLIYHLVDTSLLLPVFLFWLFTSRFMVSYILVSWKQKYLWERFFEQSWFYHHVCDPRMTDTTNVVLLQVSPEYGLWWGFRVFASDMTNAIAGRLSSWMGFNSTIVQKIMLMFAYAVSYSRWIYTLCFSL